MSGRISQWWKSIEQYLDGLLGQDISMPWARFRAHLHFLLVDHGIFRILWSNLFEIRPGVWRSNQPTRRRLERYKAKGIGTIVNLRGETPRSPYLFEAEACRDLGLKLVNHKLSARKLARSPKVLALIDDFESLDKPFVMHCKSGADRAGLAMALYLLHVEGVTVDEARRQLGLKYGHIKASRTGVLDYMLDCYAAQCEVAPMPIRDWVAEHYDRTWLQRRFDAGKPPIGSKPSKQADHPLTDSRSQADAARPRPESASASKG